VKDLKNNKRGRIKEYAEKFNVKYVDGGQPWGYKADCAFPCATQNEINEKEAKALIKNGVTLVAEGANMPSTNEAIAVYQKAKILYAPGKASNAGGVATSGLEMSQNSLRLSWSREEVNERLHGIMKDIHSQCEEHGRVNKKYIDYVKGANIAGFVKVADAMIAQGVI
jgi:glutamate dehydrogenase (NADP+)